MDNIILSQVVWLNAYALNSINCDIVLYCIVLCRDSLLSNVEYKQLFVSSAFQA
jgi:hypothetical protein